MGDEAPTNKQQFRDIFRYLAQYAPEAITAILGTTPETAEQLLELESGVAPGYEDLYRQNQIATAEAEADVVEGPGQRLVTAADKLQRQVDPEFYAQRASINDALSKYLGDYDPSQLSPTEVAEISRGINATTGPITPSAQNTIKNAMVFGDRGTERWKNFGDAITKAASTLPTLRSGIMGFDVARTRGTNTGARDAANTALGTNFGFASSALGNATGAANAAMAKRKDVFDKILMGTQAFSNIASSVGSLGFGV